MARQLFGTDGIRGVAGHTLLYPFTHGVLLTGRRALGREEAPTTAELQVDEAIDQSYVDYLAATVSGSFAGMRIVLDCANGAASHLATELFERLGATVFTVGCEPNGRNINLDSGALHVENLRK